MGTLSLSVCLVLVVLLYHVSWSFCSSVPPPSSHLCLPNQRDALLLFKNTTAYYEFLKCTESWNESIDCCSWEGVKCDNLTGHVIAVNLSDCFLLPPLLENKSLSLVSFSQLVSLTHLDLSNNDFAGIIPTQINLLSSLVSLNLSHTNLRFDGQGFDMLATNLTKLTDLVLDFVDMSDVAVNTSFLNLTSSLETLSLSSCQLHGEFPSQVFQLPNLKYLDLDGNVNLTGYLPNTKLSSALELLSLTYCGFKGSIPASFGNLTQITSIDLSGNQFQGQIPDVFGNLTKLNYVQLSSCNLSGPLPITMFNLTQVTHLHLSHNHLEGPLPNHVSGLQFLQDLELSDNSISGGVPSWLFTLPSLRNLYLCYNKIVGPIDQIQNKASYLESVDLSHNNFDGPIPDFFFDLESLTVLHFSSNILSGSIPDRISNLVNLVVLDLSSNNLSGVIKTDMLSKLTSLAVLDVSNNSLLSLSKSGNDVNYSFPLLERVSFSGCSVKHFPNFFRTSGLQILDLSDNKISGRISKWEAQGWEGLLALNLSHNHLTALEQFPGKELVILDLSSNLLEGPILSTCLNHQIPKPQWFKVFLISENKLTGNIPSSICNWTSLQFLDLSKNSLSGTIPDCLGNFSGRLQLIDLQVNNLYGKIPDSFFNEHLTHLFLNDNQLEGLVPKSLANSTSLRVLNLGNNKLTDSFPHWLASLHSLQVLILKSNRFHGSLPYSVASSNFSRLQILDISGNEFSGPLPIQLFRNLRAMTIKPEETFSLSSFLAHSLAHFLAHYTWTARYRQISVNVTTKSSELELTKNADIFVSMDLSNNQFCGQIPEEVGKLISLQILDISGNEFSGPLPIQLFNLRAMTIKPEETFSLSSFIAHFLDRHTWTAWYHQISVNVTTKSLELVLTKNADIFVSMDLSNNQFCGQIPEEVGQLISLQMLNFSHNNFTGPIPASFGNMVALESLDLSSNKLSGPIPSQMAKLTFLAKLNLSENHLTGPIPHGNQFGTFDNDSYIGNSGLCDLPLSKKCAGVEPPPPLLVTHEGSALPFFWQVVLMGYGSGVVLGVSLGYIVFTTGRPWWFIRMVERDLQPKFTNWMIQHHLA